MDIPIAMRKKIREHHHPFALQIDTNLLEFGDGFITPPRSSVPATKSSVKKPLSISVATPSNITPMHS
jgi:hypothetical protein